MHPVLPGARYGKEDRVVYDPYDAFNGRSLSCSGGLPMVEFYLYKGEDRPDAARLASQGPGEQFALYVDRALFLRSDTITIQLGSFYRLTYAPA